jgi:hypothetical protein
VFCWIYAEPKGVFGARSALSFSQLLSQVLQPVLPPGRGRTSYWIRQQAATFCAFLIPVPKRGLRGDLQVPLQVPRAASPRAIASPKTDVGGDILLSASGAGDRSLAAATTGCVGTSPLNAVRCSPRLQQRAVFEVLLEVSE